MDSELYLVGNWSGNGSNESLSEPRICSAQELIQMKLSSATVIVSVILLVIINLAVIAGNILVILAVFVSSKLRTSTNYFIVSLAMADLLVGIAVLPYSVTLEVLDVWVFGEIWCQGWLVVDVWMCTASILNLCAISVDRYLAVTRPVRYRSIMTSRRAKLLIACVWLLSFLICFPPLVGWNDRAVVIVQGKGVGADGRSPFPSTTSAPPLVFTQLSSLMTTSYSYSSSGSISYSNSYSYSNSNANYSSPTDSLLLNMSSPSGGNTVDKIGITLKEANITEANGTMACEESRYQCTLFNDKGYVLYSALGSFFIPMLVMIFFYWRIYLVASRTTRALKRGYKTTKTSKSSHGPSEERMTLRIHRGYICDEVQPKGSSAHTSTSPRARSGGVPKPRIVVDPEASPRGKGKGKGKETGDGEEEKGTELKHFQERQPRRKMPITLYRSSRLTAHLSAADAMEQNGNGSGGSGGADVGGGNGNGHEHGNISRQLSPCSDQTNFSQLSVSPGSSREGSRRSARMAATRFSRRTNTGKWQAKRFHAETKAAKTVGIIVGGFIMCWFPFFTIYLVRAFCGDSCIPELLFSIFTWLGYCNSAVNPFIYGLFSRDFRRAFKNIVCKCKFRDDPGITSLIRQIHLPTFFEEDQAEDHGKTDSQEEYK